MSNVKNNINVAIVGATGAVGNEMRRILEARHFPIDKLKLLSSARSAGKKLSYQRHSLEVEELTPYSFAGIDLALFSAGSTISKEFAGYAVKDGAIVVDNSSAFRMDPDVPLVVPEVNPKEVFKNSGIIANPNCSTIQMVVVLKPLHDRFGIKRVIVSTYQSVSGTGNKAIDELKAQAKAILNGGEPRADVYHHRIAFNIFPHIDDFENNGYTKEEMKMINETRKIMGVPDMHVTATCVRVPVMVGHGESINIEFEKPVSPAEVRALLGSAEGVKVLDDPDTHSYPMPIQAAGKDETFVGRIRQDFSAENAINLWIVADNLRKGAALNAIQIGEFLYKEGLFKGSRP